MSGETEANVSYRRRCLSYTCIIGALLFTLACFAVATASSGASSDVLASIRMSLGAMSLISLIVVAVSQSVLGVLRFGPIDKIGDGVISLVVI